MATNNANVVEEVRQVFEGDDDQWIEFGEDNREEMHGRAAIVRYFFRPESRTEECEKTEISVGADYEIVFSPTIRVEDGTFRQRVQAHHKAVVHRKVREPHARRQVHVQADAGGSSLLLVFQGGFPNGGECGADVHAPWGTILPRDAIPAGGSLIIIIPRLPSARLSPHLPVSAELVQRILDHDFFELIAKHLAPVDSLRAAHTCRAWRQLRLLCGDDVEMVACTQGAVAANNLSLHHREGYHGRNYRWFTACISRGYTPRGALLKVRLRDQKWGNKKGTVSLGGPNGLEARVAADHTAKSVKVSLKLPAQAGAERTWAPADEDWEGRGLVPACNVNYHVGGGGGHELVVQRGQLAVLAQVSART